MKITFTGHRPNKLGYEYNYKGAYTTYLKDELIKKLAHYKPEKAYVGMALGFDTISAMVCIKLGIPFIACIPCLNHASNWPPESVRLYNLILSSKLCTTYMVSNKPYTQHCMQDRNIYMCDQLNPIEDLVISAHDGSNGGTANCIQYAKSKCISVENIDLKQFLCN